jgi:cytoskeletal protein CcmA (bactofilin family)
MQKLDLSLDIPGALIVHYEAPDDDLELDFDQPTLSSPTDPRGAARLESLEGSPTHTHASGKAGSLNEASIHEQLCQALQLLGQPDTLEVAPAATLLGDVNCRSIHIKGELSGALSSGGVVMLDPESVVKGIIRNAEFVVVAGTVAGSPNGVAIRCNGLVILAGSARVVGHIQCRSIAIFEGACLVGAVQPLHAEQAAGSSCRDSSHASSSLASVH